MPLNGFDRLILLQLKNYTTLTISFEMNPDFLQQWAVQFGGTRPTFANSRVLELRSSINSMNAKFNLMSMRFNVMPRVEELPTDAETIGQIFVLLESIVEELRNASSPQDQAQFIISSRSLDSRSIIPFQEIVHVTETIYSTKWKRYFNLTQNWTSVTELLL